MRSQPMRRRESAPGRDRLRAHRERREQGRLRPLAPAGPGQCPGRAPLGARYSTLPWGNRRALPRLIRMRRGLWGAPRMPGRCAPRDQWDPRCAADSRRPAASRLPSVRARAGSTPGRRCVRARARAQGSCRPDRRGARAPREFGELRAFSSLESSWSIGPPSATTRSRMPSSRMRCSTTPPGARLRSSTPSSCTRRSRMPRSATSRSRMPPGASTRSRGPSFASRRSSAPFSSRRRSSAPSSESRRSRRHARRARDPAGRPGRARDPAAGRRR